jgi:HAD-superfamily hydrolase subfamily IA
MFDTISQVDEIDDIYCFCSDESIKEYLSGRVQFLKRGKELDTAETKCQDIVSSFLEKVDVDIIVLAHVTSPFVKVESIRECVKQVCSGEYDSAFTAGVVQDFLWQDGKPLNFDPSSIARTQDLPRIYKESVGCYVFTKDVFEKTGRRIGYKPYICEVDSIEEVDIDYPEDFVIANAIYDSLRK